MDASEPHERWLYTIEARDKLDLSGVARRLSIQERMLDESFGLLLLDPKRGLYCFQTKQLLAEPIGDSTVTGPWASPAIEGFGGSDSQGQLPD